MTTTKRSGFIAGVSLAALLVAGCGGGLFVEREEARPQTIISAGHQVTEAVVSKVDGPAGPILATNFVTTVTPQTVTTNWITNRLVVVNPAIERTLGVIGQVNEVANPTPFAPAITGGLALVSVVLGWIARVKSERAKLLPAIIQGVELARDEKVKESIRKVADGMGLERQLNAVVKKFTG